MHKCHPAHLARVCGVAPLPPQLAGEVEKDAFRKREREQESNYSYSQAKRLLEARMDTACH